MPNLKSVENHESATIQCESHGPENRVTFTVSICGEDAVVGSYAHKGSLALGIKDVERYALDQSLINTLICSSARLMRVDMFSTVPTNIWLDDQDEYLRKAPEGWLHCYDIEAVKKQLSQRLVDFLSLDHDLGDGKGSGLDLLHWMRETGRWSVLCPQVHSMNPVGAANMRAFIDRYFGERL